MSEYYNVEEITIIGQCIQFNKTCVNIRCKNKIFKSRLLRNDQILEIISRDNVKVSYQDLEYLKLSFTDEKHYTLLNKLKQEYLEQQKIKISKEPSNIIEKEKTITFHTDNNGFCDQLVGITNLIILIKKLNLPHQLKINWSTCTSILNHITIYPKYQSPKIEEPEIEIYNFSWEELTPDYYKEKHELYQNFLKNTTNPNLHIKSNLPFAIWAYTNEQEYFSDLKHASEQLFQKIFKINENITIPTYPKTIGYQIRTYDLDELYISESNEEIYNSIIELKNLNPKKSIFITSDSQDLINFLKEKNLIFYHNDNPIEHSSFPESNTLKVITDILTLTQCDEIYIYCNNDFGTEEDNGSNMGYMSYAISKHKYFYKYRDNKIIKTNKFMKNQSYIGTILNKNF